MSVGPSVIPGVQRRDGDRALEELFARVEALERASKELRRARFITATRTGVETLRYDRPSGVQTRNVEMQIVDTTPGTFDDIGVILGGAPAGSFLTLPAGGFYGITLSAFFIFPDPQATTERLYGIFVPEQQSLWANRFSWTLPPNRPFRPVVPIDLPEYAGDQMYFELDANVGPLSFTSELFEDEQDAAYRASGSDVTATGDPAGVPTLQLDVSIIRYGAGLSAL